MKLLVDNGLATGGVLLSDTFEVATDATFATLVVSKSVPQSASGQTSLILDPLGPATYYWRVRAAASDATTVTSPTFSFKVVLPAPVLVSPADEAQVPYHTEPVKLLVDNGVATGGVLVSDMFEVATDSAFMPLLVGKSVSQNASGQTTLMLEPLSPATYYWRVRAAAGDATVTSPTFTFSIGAQLVIHPPVPVQPLSGSFQHKRPTFIVANATRTGPAATLTYRFEVATNTAFSALVTSGAVPEGPSQTSFTLTSDLVSGGRFYWRAQATDSATAVASGYSATQTFMTVAPDDGTFPYTFVLHIPDTCTRYYLPADWPLDGPLVVSGDQLRFFVSTPRCGVGGTASFSLDIARAGTHLSGAIGGAWNYGPIGSNVCIIVSKTDNLSDRALWSGSTNNDGRLSGTFDGFVFAGNPIHEAVRCLAPGFTWTLTPR